MRPRKESIFRRSGNRFAAENATTKGKHFPAKWKPVRRGKCDHERKAFSGEVETGSPQKMRPRKDNRSEFRFHRKGIRPSDEKWSTHEHSRRHGYSPERRRQRATGCRLPPRRLV